LLCEYKLNISHMKTSIIKEQFSIDYILNSSVKILFNRLSCPLGLSEWFADNVTLKDDIFTFHWGKHSQKARLLSVKEPDYIRFKWIDNKANESENDYYFEFQVFQDDLTGDVHLTVTDFASPDEIEDAKILWDTQINDLIRLIGA